MRNGESTQPARAVAFDLEGDTLASFRTALPDWKIDAINGATPAYLARRWNPGAAHLLVVGASADPAVTLGLCRFLSFCAEYAIDARAWEAKTMRPRECPFATPLLVLVPPEQKTLAPAALNAGAHHCLVLPIRPQDVVSLLARAFAGNLRNAFNLGQTAIDRWRDDGGQQ